MSNRIKAACTPSNSDVMHAQGAGIVKHVADTAAQLQTARLQHEFNVLLLLLPCPCPAGLRPD